MAAEDCGCVTSASVSMRPGKRGCWGLGRVLLGQEKLEHAQRLGEKRKRRKLEVSNTRRQDRQTSGQTTEVVG